ncbi:ATP-dependent DNA helicase RecG [Rothia dentocariosa]|uniref:ATP-dependent DNA helicase RecG n=1 Tax=Rothia dentocariosa TaxID=2047 RepID=UPI00247503C4|nr:ATP-dependent DNA helicase RecG [Rothia dentocariosa]
MTVRAEGIRDDGVLRVERRESVSPQNSKEAHNEGATPSLFADEFLESGFGQAKKAAEQQPTDTEHSDPKSPAILSEDELVAHEYVTVRDLAEYARGTKTLTELSTLAHQRESSEYQRIVDALRASLGAAAQNMETAELYELADIAYTARTEAPSQRGTSIRGKTKKSTQTASQKPAAKKAKPTRTNPKKSKHTRSGAETSSSEQKNSLDSHVEEPHQEKSKPKNTVKTPAKKPARKKTADPKKTDKPAARVRNIKYNSDSSQEQEKQQQRAARSQVLARYNDEKRLENAPLTRYLPTATARALKTHLSISTVGELLEYFPRKYLPRGELSRFADLVEGQDVTIIARVTNVSTRTMAARRGKITEVTITDTLAESDQNSVDNSSSGTFAVREGRANTPQRMPAGKTNPRVSGLAAPSAGYSGYADSYGQQSSGNNFFGVPQHIFGSSDISGTGRVGSTMKLSFFNAWTAAREIHAGETMMFSGKVGIYRGEYTLTNPHYALLSDDGNANAPERAEAPIPVYRAPVKLPTDRIATAIAQLIESVPLKELEDPIPYRIRRARKVPSLEWTYRALHTPDSEDTWRAAQAQMRYREAFVLQSALARLHAARAAHATVARSALPDGAADALLNVLPYELTEGQQRVGKEISRDLASPSPMNRLLQGDVGSGKTVVALRAMLQVADSGGQSAMLAPTEVLAEQHFRSILDILGDLADTEGIPGYETTLFHPQNQKESKKTEHRVRVRLLSASMPSAHKRAVLAEIADGTADVVIGTHALLSDTVTFRDLGMVVVDEQHRFGVEQRDSLRGNNGELPHRLVMTATPIPRTVAMTVFGDLDVSVLDQLPAGRQQTATHVVPLAEKPTWADRLWTRAREEIDAGHQVYVVVPKIGDDDEELEEGQQLFGDAGREGSQSSDGKIRLTSVTAMTAYLKQNPALTGTRIASLHGRMDPEEKTAVMTAFERGEIDILVSTTVIEVGVNVPNATLMMIMDADRFGISGLHQLRGRVGRGGFAGTCLLVTRQQAGGVSRERLDAVAATTDGFKLSQIDLQQRREGDILGAAQSGKKSTLKFLRALADATIIERAREDARALIAADPTLAKHPNLARTIDRALDADREAFLGRG